MNLDRPRLGDTPGEAAAFVRSEIQRALPPAWHVTGLDRFESVTGRADHSPAITGYIEKREHGMHGCYGVRIPLSLELLMFTWGNSSAGVLDVPQAMSRALVIDAPFLHLFGMEACLRHLFTFPPSHLYLT